MCLPNVVPTQIHDDLSSNDVTVREHADVTLVCNVTGEPQPTVTWYRENPPTVDAFELPTTFRRHQGPSPDCNLLEVGNGTEKEGSLLLSPSSG
jgi:hypothetical protein